MELGRGLAEIGAGIAVAGIAFALSQCAQVDRKQKTEDLKVCLDHGGAEDQFGKCVIKGRPS